MTRRKETPFRPSQARVVLIGVLQTLAPRMTRADALQELMRELVLDRQLWIELELAARPVVVNGVASTPATSTTMTAAIATDCSEPRP